MSNSSHNFWNFSLAIYNKPEVTNACLALQNSYGLDVNMVLLCCWYGSWAGELSEDLLHRTFGYSRQWRQQVVQPLRDSRNWMKLNASESSLAGESEFMELREQIKAVELKSEKYQQQVLEQLILNADKPAPTQTDYESAIPAPLSIDEQKSAIYKNLAGLLMLAGIAETEEIREKFAVVTNATTAD